MAVGYKIKMTFDRPADFSSRGWKEVIREALRQAAEHWHAEIMPRHFDQDARSRYGYQPRTANYQKSKIKAMARGKAVGAMDLVLTGQTRDSAMKRPLIKAFPTRARVDLLVPPYINMRPNRSKGSKAPSLGEELTRLRFDESEELAEFAMRSIALEISGTTSSLMTTGRSRRVSSASTRTNSSRHPEWMQSYTVICE